MRNKTKRPMFARMLAGTVLAGSLAFAAQAEAQQQRQAGQARPERGAMGRGGRGPMGDPAQMVGRRVSMLTEELALTTGQATAIRQILIDQHAQMDALRPAGPPRGMAGDSAARRERRQRPDSAARAAGRVRPDSAAREQLRTQMDAQHEQTNARIEAVLSGEQRTAFQELVAKRGERAEGGRGRGPGGQGRGRGGQRPPPPPAK